MQENNKLQKNTNILQKASEEYKNNETTTQIYTQLQKQ